MPDLMTTGEVAAMLNVSPRTLEDWRVRREGPPFRRLSPKCVRHHCADVLTWLESRPRIAA
jgi:DNA-binding transcriptional MerR regulator